MGNGYISYYNTNYKGLTLDESHYVRVPHDAVFDMGTEDFSLGCIFYCDSTVGNKADKKILINKSDTTLASDNGYVLWYDATNEKMYLSMNDGDVAAHEAVTANSSFLDDTYHYVWVSVDRNVGATFYLNGTALTNASDDITDAAGSINAAEDVFIGGYSSGNNNLKGLVSAVHICKGFLPDATWVERWYYRMKSGMERSYRNLYYDSVLFNFNNNLEGHRLDYHPAIDGNFEDATQIHYGNYAPSGTPTYSQYDPYLISMTLTDNYAYEFEHGYQPLDIIMRTQDGSAKIYAGANKQRAFLFFTSNSLQQRYFFEGAWASKSLLNVMLDVDGGTTFFGYMIAPPIVREIYTNVFQYEVEIEEA